MNITTDNQHGDKTIKSLNLKKKKKKRQLRSKYEMRREMEEESMQGYQSAWSSSGVRLVFIQCLTFELCYHYCTKKI